MESDSITEALVASQDDSMEWKGTERTEGKVYNSKKLIRLVELNELPNILNPYGQAMLDNAIHHRKHIPKKRRSSAHRADVARLLYYYDTHMQIYNTLIVPHIKKLLADNSLSFSNPAYGINKRSKHKHGEVLLVKFIARFRQKKDTTMLTHFCNIQYPDLKLEITHDSHTSRVSNEYDLWLHFIREE